MYGKPVWAAAIALCVACAGSGPPAPSAPPSQGTTGGEPPVEAPLAASERPLEHLIYALPSVSGLFVPPMLAEELGYFREEGLQVETPVVRANLLLPALVSGEADYIAAISSAVRAALSGRPRAHRRRHGRQVEPGISDGRARRRVA